MVRDGAPVCKVHGLIFLGILFADIGQMHILFLTMGMAIPRNFETKSYADAQSLGAHNWEKAS